MFGKKDDKQKDDAEVSRPMTPRARPFSDFRDPFTNGQADNLPFDDLVRYSFDAMQAWAAEHDSARQEEQTPQEFARAVAHRWSQMARQARTLAALYNQVAYAPGTASRQGMTELRQLWAEMRSLRVAA